MRNHHSALEADLQPASPPPPAATYADYLGLDVLLTRQQPRSEPQARDELLFIVTHQACELWFKVLLDELERARRAMFEDALPEARRAFARIHVVQRLITDQLGVLETMTAVSFAEFRPMLGTSSAFQSVQAREVEFLSGARDARYVRAVAESPADQDRLRQRLSEPSIGDAFERVLARRWPSASGGGERLRLLLGRADEDGSLRGLAEDLLTYDRQAQAWRERHLRLVEMLIGEKNGTGGSAGASYLRGRVGQGYFPQLRAALGSEADA